MTATIHPLRRPPAPPAPPPDAPSCLACRGTARVRLLSHRVDGRPIYHCLDCGPLWVRQHAYTARPSLRRP